VPSYGTTIRARSVVRPLGSVFDRVGTRRLAPDRLRAALAERGINGVFGNISDPAGRQKILDEILGGRSVDTFCATVIRQEGCWRR